MSLRYLRQVDIVNQDRLRDSTVCVIGAGGLGSSALYYLVAAGIGRVVFVDHDKVDETNLNRQILHFTSDIGKIKVFSAYEKLRNLNPDIELVPIFMKLDRSNIFNVIKDVDVVIDCLDNLETRFLLNEICYELGVPFIHGVVERFEGRITFVNPKESSPCLECLYGKPKAYKKEFFSVVGVTPGVVGTIEANIAIQYLSFGKSLLLGELLIVDLESLSFTKLIYNKKINCSVCGG